MRISINDKESVKHILEMKRYFSTPKTETLIEFLVREAYKAMKQAERVDKE